MAINNCDAFIVSRSFPSQENAPENSNQKGFSFEGSDQLQITVRTARRVRPVMALKNFKAYSPTSGPWTSVFASYSLTHDQALIDRLTSNEMERLIQIPFIRHAKMSYPDARHASFEFPPHRRRMLRYVKKLDKHLPLQYLSCIYAVQHIRQFSLYDKAHRL